MPTLEEKAFAEIKQLADNFRGNERFYLSSDYQEQEARKDFIDKFFIALGWDVNHDIQKNPFEQEVKVERGVNVRGVQKRADYAFYVGNYRDVRFFVEAKKPHGDIATPENYFQTIRYGWNAQTPLAVLTDFEEFHVLDCRYKPDIDSSTQCAVKTYHYTEYENRDKFAEIYHLFSRESVSTGSLEKFSETMPKRRGKAIQRGLFAGAYKGIDEAFLEELDDYRKTLAHMFKDADSSLDGETLTEITQRTIDRLVFTRFLEDRQIEAEPIVARFGEKGSAWGDFLAASRRLDRIYNGIVFKHHDILDSPALKVDDVVFAKIREDLSHINTPYDFNIIPIHILGSIYERFLGKVISAGPERVRVDEKPEVRKAGGVYYTPQYIVKYIVENAVGKMIEGKTPEQIAEMRFADISCGSGSFLLGMFDTLLEYHRRYYNKYKSKIKNGDCVERDGVLYLSLKKRRAILLNNLYGVDIDAQAVEVAQLSLYLKLLEDETLGTTHNYQREFQETLLPSLNKNIVCGNSLVGTDVLSGHLFPGDEERKLNPMDFAARFQEVMRAGGFDAIVGNPPWGAELSNLERQNLVIRYPIVPTKTKDSYFYFICRAIDLLRDFGYLGYIVPNTWLLINSASEFRRHLLTYNLKEISDQGDGVFPQATVESAIILLTKETINNSSCHAVRIRKRQVLIDHTIDQNVWLADGLCRIIIDADENIRHLLDKLGSRGEPFKASCVIIWGIKPYQVGYGVPPQSREMVENRVYHATEQKGKEWKPLLVGANINRYALHFPGNQFIKYGKWLMYPSNEKLMQSPKILLRQTSDILRACYDNQGFYCQNSVFIIHSNEIDLKYLAGLLNSKLIGFVYKINNPQIGKVFAEIKPSVIKDLPIRKINASIESEKMLQDEMIRLVDAMLTAKTQLTKVKTDKDRSYYEQKCATLDHQIDDLVYKLYDLTEAEIQMVEETAKK